jgi:hypothetical protein
MCLWLLVKLMREEEGQTDKDEEEEEEGELASVRTA